MDLFNQNVHSTVYPNGPAGLIFPGDPQWTWGQKSIAYNRYKVFTPRLGLSWDPKGDGKMSIRAAAGMFTDRGALYSLSALAQDAPFRHWAQIVATDFFTVEVWTCSGLTRFVVLFFIDLSTRRVEISGIASLANGLWMNQIARNLTDAVDGLLARKRYLIHDRDPLYTKEFLSILAAAGIESVKLPPRSPNLNAYAERFVRTINESCLEQMIFFGEDANVDRVHNIRADQIGATNGQRINPIGLTKVQQKARPHCKQFNPKHQKSTRFHVFQQALKSGSGPDALILEVHAIL